jgi:uridine kinase
MPKPYIIGIAGGTASGKTYLVKALQAELGKKGFSVLSIDDFYKPRHEQPLDERGEANFDTLESIAWNLFWDKLNALLNDQSIQIKKYNFNNPALPEQIETIEPHPVLIIEGLFCLAQPQLKALLDLKIFMDPDDTIKVFRRIERDHQERGYDLEDVSYRYLHHVLPAYRTYLEPYKALCDLVLPNQGSLQPVVEVLSAWIRTRGML